MEIEINTFNNDQVVRLGGSRCGCNGGGVFAGCQQRRPPDTGAAEGPEIGEKENAP